MERRRAAITGLGLVSPLGVGYEVFAESVVNGVSGLGPWSGSEEPVLVGEVLDFKAADYFVADKTYLDRCSELALAAAKLALDHAGLSAMPAAEERSGVVLGSYGCVDTALRYRERVAARGIRFATPLIFTHALANTPASLISIDFHLKGYHATVCGGDGSGGAALHTALVGLFAGHADALLAGAAASLPPAPSRFWATDDPDAYDPTAVEDFPHAAGEGACLFLLETEESARARDAVVHGWLSWDEPPGEVWHVGSGRHGLPAGAMETSCVPHALYGDGAARGALDVAAALAGLSAGVMPPVRFAGADGREPQTSRARSAMVFDRPSAALTRLVVSLP
jgi:3-oxoacyl-[acyl-carrier-protein] synthase II